MNVEDDDEVIVLNEDIADDERVVKENHRRVLVRSFDTPQLIALILMLLMLLMLLMIMMFLILGNLINSNVKT